MTISWCTSGCIIFSFIVCISNHSNVSSVQCTYALYLYIDVLCTCAGHFYTVVQCTLKYNVVYLYFNCTISMSRLVLMSYVIKCTKPNQDLGQVRNQCILTQMSSSISLETNVCMFRVNLDNKRIHLTMLVPIFKLKFLDFQTVFLNLAPPPQIMFNL